MDIRWIACSSTPDYRTEYTVKHTVSVHALYCSMEVRCSVSSRLSCFLRALMISSASTSPTLRMVRPVITMSPHISAQPSRTWRSKVSTHQRKWKSRRRIAAHHYNADSCGQNKHVYANLGQISGKGQVARVFGGSHPPLS